jgi:RNA polymerase sigma-70 factor (ECF subfamily)
MGFKINELQCAFQPHNRVQQITISLAEGAPVTAISACKPTAFSLSNSVSVAYAPRMEHRPDDSALMLRYRDGDVSAFELLYRRHNDALYRYLLRLCRHPATAEDVFQEVWGKIIKARDNYRPTAKFTTYLYRIAYNSFIDHVRRNKRHANTADIEPDSQPDAGESPDMLTERGLARVFLLHEEAGLSLDQIASVTDCKRETAKSRLRYAISKLRAAIDEPTEIK